MSGFLQKLKSGAVAVDNNAPPDNSGMITRRLEKRFANEPANTLGIKLSSDAEVTAVEPGTAAARANIPVGYMIFDVNSEFVENDIQFLAAAERSLNLIIKLQSVSSMSELIGKLLREEENLSVEEVRKKLHLDELARTTPRYSFLASDHPLFRRYTSRLRSRREATALLRQREREAEERIQRENRERIHREIEAAQAEAKLAEEKAKREEEERRETLVPTPLPPQPGEHQNQTFLPVIEDMSTFGKLDSPLKEAVKPEPLPEQKGHEEPPQKESTPTFNPISTAELLALLGKPTDLSPAPPEEKEVTAFPPVTLTNGNGTQASILGDTKEVRYVILPSEEYVLQSGEKIIASLKSRTGPLPSPPPGKPPKISREAREALKKIAEGGDKKQSASDDDDSSGASDIEMANKRNESNRRERFAEHKDNNSTRRHQHHSSRSDRNRKRDRERDDDRDRDHAHHHRRSHRRDRSEDRHHRNRDHDKRRYSDSRDDRHHRSSHSSRHSRR